MTNDSKDYTNVLLEDIREQMKAVLEVSIGTRNMVAKLPTRDEFNELKDDVITIKTAVKDTNKELKLLERRVTKVEEKVA